MGLPQHLVAMTAGAYIAWKNQLPARHALLADVIFGDV